MCYNHDMNFTDKVKQAVKAIPKGQTRTYQQIAAEAGNPRAARAVGVIMKNNYDPAIPCHRVVAKNSIGGYNRGVSVKRKLLAQEGALR